MFLLGLLLAFTSKAHTPIRPKGAGFAAGLIRRCAIHVDEEGDKPSSLSLW